MPRRRRRRTKRAGVPVLRQVLALLLVLGLAILGWAWWRHTHSEAGASVSPVELLHSLLATQTTSRVTPSQPASAAVPDWPAPRNPIPKPLPVPLTPMPSVPVASEASGNVKTPSGSARAGSLTWQEVLEAQVALVQHGISPGSLDGLWGSQTRAAVRAFQLQQHLPISGQLDAPTMERLQLNAPLFTRYTVTRFDLARLQLVGRTWLAKSQQSRLDYESVLELVAEQSQSHPNLIRRLNARVDWSRLVAGTELTIPNARFPPVEQPAAHVRIFLHERVLEAFDAEANLLAHFPCSIARRVEKRPIGELRVAVVVPDPNYTFDPRIFPESAEGRRLGRKLVVPPGPNNPVGTVWIGLDKPRYGIHGTPVPEKVGRTESHGCFRLANWNAAYLLRLVWVGLPVHVEP